MRFQWNAVVWRRRLVAATALFLGVLVSLVFSTNSRASVNTVQFSTSPALYPAFNPAISDYVVRCTGTTPVQVSILNSDASDTTTTVSVDGQAPKAAGIFTTLVSLAQGQGFKITSVQGAAAKDYYIRCLPNGFPNWGSQRPGSPQAEYYVVVPVPTNGVGIANRYITIYDTNGVPIWWILPEYPHRPWDAKLLPNKEILWTESDTNNAMRALKAEHRRLDGSIVDDEITPVGYQLDAHEVQRLDNGNYLVFGTYGRCCYNLASHNGPSSATIRDDVFQEVTPEGTPVWTWFAADHIGIDEVQQQWWSTIIGAGSPYDVFHFNSVVKDGANNLLASARHLNAVYKISNPTGQTRPGNVLWKLGGSTPTLELGTRLTISGDPVFTSGSGFGGQHYAHYFNAGDGKLYVTLYDNGSLRNRPPRGVRYEINEQVMTATLVEDVRNTASPNMTSPCCGSAGKLPAGNWFFSWGGNPLMTELTPSGGRAFVLTFTASSYRADAVMPGVVTRAELRSGMDAQYPRIVNNAPQASGQAVSTAEETPVGITLAASDTDGQPLTYSIVSGPTRGVLSGSGVNRTYTPNLNYNGADSFTFWVNDGFANSNTAIVNITVTATPDSPVANNSAVTTNAGVPVNFNLSASDADGDALVYSVVSAPGQGSLSGSGTNRTYTPNPGFAGTDNFTFRVNDGQLDSNLASVSISVIAPPIGTLIGSFSTPSGVQNLSGLGTFDWAHWGLTTSTSYNHKAGVTPQISNFTAVGAATTTRFTTHPFGFSWTNGTPTVSATDTRTGVSRSVTGGGFRISVPAGLEQRTLFLFVGVRTGAQGSLVAQLSDGSAPLYTDTSFTTTSTGTAGRLYMLVYKAGTSGQTLTATFTRDSSTGSVTLEAAALAGAPVSVPSVVGKTQTEASALLTGAGLVVGAVSTASHATIPNGSVISQSPAADESVPAGTAVALVTSIGTSPTAVSPAAAIPAIVAGTTASLSVLGGDDGGEANLVYTWTTVATPPGPVTFSANGSNAAKNTVAAFTKAGSYTFRVTIRDSVNLTATSDVGVNVNQTLTTITVAPQMASVVAGGTHAFGAIAADQFGTVLASQPSLIWAVSGGGAISSSGLFTAGSDVGGPFSVTASAAGWNGAASVTVTAVAASTAQAFVQGATATNNYVGASISTSFTTANTAGNLIVVAVAWGNNSGVTCSDTQGNTYVVATTQHDSTRNRSLAICYAANVKSGANTVTASFGFSGGTRRVLIHEYSGIALTNPVDVSARNLADGSTAANAITSTAATTTASGDLIFGAVMDTAGVTSVTAGPGFTQRLSVNNKDLVSEDLVQATPGSVAAVHTFGAAHRYLAQMVAFKRQ